MTKVEGGWVKDDGTKMTKGEVTELKSGAILTTDEFDNVWYNSDVEMIIGKLYRGRFLPTPKQDFSPELLVAISEIFTRKYGWNK
jgi:hypothetical protein